MPREIITLQVGQVCETRASHAFSLLNGNSIPTLVLACAMANFVSPCAVWKPNWIRVLEEGADCSSSFVLCLLWSQL